MQTGEPVQPGARLFEQGSRRHGALVRTGLLDTPPEETFDRLTRMVASLLGAPAAILSLVDDSRQFPKSGYGLPAALSSPEAQAEPEPFCTRVVGGQRPMFVADAGAVAADERGAWANAHGFVTYCGAPVTAGGETIGALCVLDRAPRAWTAAELGMLQDVAEIANREISGRVARRTQGELRGQFLWLMNLLPVGVYATDPEGRLVYYNERVAAFWGQRPAIGDAEHAAYSTAPLVVEGREVDAADLPARAALGAEQPIEDREMSTSNSALLVSSNVIRDASGVPLGAVAVLHDVTALRQAARLKDEVLALVSHELRTPLTVINGMAGVLRDRWPGLSDSDRASAIEDISASGRRVTRALENMLLLTEIQHEMAEPVPLHVRQLFEGAIADHRRDFPGSQVRTVLGAGSTAVLGVEPWMRIILVNLLSNAELYGRSTEPPLLEAAGEDGSIILRLTDGGPGLAEDECERVFEPFFRGKRLDSGAPGAGLGLTVARRLAEAQGGTLTATPRDGSAGTTLMLRLPAAPIGVGG